MSDNNGFLERLRLGPIVCDGAMGTMLASLASGQYRTPEELNRLMPEVVSQVHRGYIQAGAQVIEANTFGGNRIRLARFGLAADAAQLNRLGAALAKEEAAGKVLVAGDIGPTGEFLEPLGSLSLQEARDAFAEQAAALADGGVDLFIVETMSDMEEVRAAIEGVRSVSSLPLVCTMTFDTGGRTMMGVAPEEAARSLVQWGADVVGANCGVGPAETEAVLRRMRQAVPSLLLAAQPNAGMPRVEGDRAVYDVGPQEFATYARRFAEMGVRLIGSCCGSTPEYTRAIVAALQQSTASS